MNPADLAILAIVLVSVIVSLFRGFIKEVFSILVWIAAIYAAFQVSGAFAGELEPYIELPSARFIVAFAAVFVLVLVVGGLISFLIGKMIEQTGLSPTDRLFGALFGAVRGAVVVTVAVLLVRATPLSEDPWWGESKLLPTFDRLADHGLELLPESVRELLDADPEPADDAPSRVSEALMERL